MGFSTSVLIVVQTGGGRSICEIWGSLLIVHASKGHPPNKNSFLQIIAQNYVLPRRLARDAVPILQPEVLHEEHRLTSSSLQN